MNIEKALKFLNDRELYKNSYPEDDLQEHIARQMQEYSNEQLLIQRVSQQRELLEAYTKQIKEDNELTEEITFQDINKCIASNCG